MGIFVFRDRPPHGPALLFFDGNELTPLPEPPGAGGPENPRPDWGRGGRGAHLAAWMLCVHCGVPGDLLSEVARLLEIEWVRHLPKGQQTIPEWVVQQEVVRLCVRVMCDPNGQ